MPEKRDIRQEITDKIIGILETAGDGEKWVMPWTHGGRFGRPHNAVTGHKYRGINTLHLGCAAIAAGYATEEWASFKQWKERGASVRKGERGSLVVYVGRVVREGDADPVTGEETKDAFSFLKYSHVFNAAQVDGYDAKPIERPNLAQRIDTAERFIAASGARIDFGGGRAYYAPGPDKIGMPDWDQFKDTDGSTATENAYSTLLHELTHWTGAKHRLDRTKGERFGDDAYAFEELVAELGAAFMTAELGISNEPRADHAHYLASWLRVLKRDKGAIFQAAARASDAAEYLHALQQPDAIAA